MSQPSKNKKSTSIDNAYGHQMPADFDMEKVLLGALLKDKDAYSLVCEILRPESFYEPRNQEVFAAISELAAEDEPVNIISVTHHLQKSGKLEAIGGSVYLIDLSDKVASSANIEYYASVVAQKFLARQLIEFAADVEGKAYDVTYNPDDLLEYAEERIFELSRKELAHDFVSMSDAVKESHDAMMKAYSNRGELTGIPTGYVRLDEKTNGLHASDLIIIAGRPAMGKTAFALCLLKNAAVDRKIPMAFFSLEMSRIQLTNRLISMVTDIELSKINSGQLSRDEFEKYDQNIQTLFNAPCYIDDTPGLSLTEMRMKARRLVREHGVKAIIVDYLQLMNANGMRFSSRQEEVSIISRSLKALAKGLNVPILALSQLNRGVESREGLEGKRPQLSDLRESGSIEQDADIVLLVHRPEYYHIYQDDKGQDLHGMAQIIVAKHRNGATGDVLLKFDGEHTMFMELDDKHFDSQQISDDKLLPADKDPFEP